MKGAIIFAIVLLVILLPTFLPQEAQGYGACGLIKYTPPKYMGAMVAMCWLELMELPDIAIPGGSGGGEWWH